MFRRFITWLGPQRAWALFLLLGGTGAVSLMLQAVGPDVAWVVPVQNGLLLIWLVGTVVILVSRLDSFGRRPLLISVGPLLIGIAVGLFVPPLLPWFAGAGLGWLIVSQFILRRGVRREYRQAIQHLRRGEYDQAVQIMNGLIRAEPEDSAHYRFRAELRRLQGKPGRALQDYRRIIELEPDSGVGYNGLAEVYLQEGDFEQALTYAQQAYAREPDHWVAPYNLGMVEDRLGMASEAVEHLQSALRAGLESRHRLLIHLWLARAYARLGRGEDVSRELAALREQRRGLKDWQTIFESEQAETLRGVLGADVELAQRIFDGAGAEVFSAGLTAVEAES